MNGEGEAPAPETAREVILRLTPKRIAGWCNVTESAVWQWLSRKADTAEPVPPRHVPAIIAGARAEGLTFNARTLWPAMPTFSEAA